MTRWATVVATDSAQPGDVDKWLRTLDGGPRGFASRALDDKAGDGDVVWSRSAPDGEDVPGGAEPAPGIHILEHVAAKPLVMRHVPLEGPRHLRTLFIRVRDGVDTADIELMETALVAMPDHIASIRSWSLSRLDHGATAAGWTHLWEQEFQQSRGFRPYMGHPYHWTGVERWFDPEVPRHVVVREAHYVSPVPGPVITEQEES